MAALDAEGVRHVFGIPGVHNLAIYDALLRQDRITHVLARHEQGAGFMADGYARASGRPGVVVVTTGPGATNALTPLVESYAGSQPVLLVMSDVPSALVGQDLGALHEVPNQIECFRPVSRWADALRSGARDSRRGPGRVRPLPDRPAGPGRAVDPDRSAQRARRGAAHARRRGPAAAVRRRTGRGGGPLPRAGPAAAPRRGRRRDRGGGDGRAPGARAPARGAR